MRVPDDVFAQICAEIDAVEQSGDLDGIFKGDPRAPDQRQAESHSCTRFHAI